MGKIPENSCTVETAQRAFYQHVNACATCAWHPCGACPTGQAIQLDLTFAQSFLRCNVVGVVEA